MTELQEYLNLYFGLKEEHLEPISELFKETHLNKGDFYTKQGKSFRYLSFIKSGHFRIYANHNGKDITQWIGSPGEFVTELSSLMFDAPSRFNIEAITDCELYTIKYESYKKINDIIPQWSEIEKLFLAKCFTIIESRVFSFLAMTAEERYNQLFESNKDLFNQVPLQYLASMLGMSPETMSRIRSNSK